MLADCWQVWIRTLSIIVAGSRTTSTSDAVLSSDDYGSRVERKAGLKCYGKGMYGDVLVWVCRRVCVELAVTELKALTRDSASPIAVAAAYVGELPYRSTTRAGCPQAVDE